MKRWRPTCLTTTGVCFFGRRGNRRRRRGRFDEVGWGRWFIFERADRFTSNQVNLASLVRGRHLHFRARGGGDWGACAAGCFEVEFLDATSDNTHLGGD